MSLQNIVKYSPHIQALFEKLEDEIAPGSLCNRWTVKADSMKGIINKLPTSYSPTIPHAYLTRYPAILVQTQPMFEK